MNPPAISALLSVQPTWTRLARAADLIALPGRWLLHAGPPFADRCQPTAPVLSSAVLACLYEGWAANEADAERLISSGEVHLVPAQSQRCVTPLASVVSPRTTVIVIEDAEGRVPPTCAPLGTTGGTDLRFGTRDPKIVERLVSRDGELAAALSAALAAPTELLPIARVALAAGDDLHNRTTAATNALVEALAPRLGARTIEALRATPLFFLTFWMAAAKLMLSAAEGKAPSTLITRMGGNGESFGVSLAGAADAWITTPAEAPVGAYLPGAPKEATAAGAIGDSAVIDALGFGGQALQHAPEPREALTPYLSDDLRETAQQLLQAAHPAFDDKRVGIDARTIVDERVRPIITLGMVERGGTHGLLGRGVYRPPLGLFETAIERCI